MASITLAIRQFLASLSRNPQTVKYGAAGAAGAVGGWELQNVYRSISKPFTVNTNGQSMNLLPLLIIGALLYVLYKKKVI